MGNVTLYCEDFRRVMFDLEPGSLDAVIADLPYPKKYLPLYSDLAQLAARDLKPGGSYLSIFPHYALPGLINVTSAWLKFRWLCSMMQPDGAHPRMAMGIEVMHKPIAWFVKGAWPRGRGFVRDGFVSPGPLKILHEWQQNLAWARYCLKFVPKGGRVIDPAMGAGTLGIACILDRPDIDFIGCEIDLDTFAKAEKTIKCAAQNEKDTIIASIIGREAHDQLQAG